MIGAEIFLPGGIVGMIGAIALMAAVIVGFSAFGAQGGLISAALIALVAGLCVIIWMRFFPHTRLGRRLTLSKDARLFKSAREPEELVGKTGSTLTALRPSGIARIEGRRTDVVAEGSWIDPDKPIRVIQVEGFKVLVRELEEPQTKEAE
jgi:membrane-bound serine protease (ClpP class)